MRANENEYLFGTASRKTALNNETGGDKSNNCLINKTGFSVEYSTSKDSERLSADIHMSPSEPKTNHTRLDHRGDDTSNATSGSELDVMFTTSETGNVTGSTETSNVRDSMFKIVNTYRQKSMFK